MDTKQKTDKGTCSRYLEMSTNFMKSPKTSRNIHKQLEMPKNSQKLLHQKLCKDLQKHLQTSQNILKILQISTHLEMSENIHKHLQESTNLYKKFICKLLKTSPNVYKCLDIQKCLKHLQTSTKPQKCLKKHRETSTSILRLQQKQLEMSESFQKLLQASTNVQKCLQMSIKGLHTSPNFYKPLLF